MTKSVVSVREDSKKTNVVMVKEDILYKRISEYGLVSPGRAQNPVWCFYQKYGCKKYQDHLGDDNLQLSTQVIFMLCYQHEDKRQVQGNGPTQEIVNESPRATHVEDGPGATLYDQSMDRGNVVSAFFEDTGAQEPAASRKLRKTKKRMCDVSWRSDVRRSCWMIRGNTIGLSMFLSRPHYMETL